MSHRKFGKKCHWYEADGTPLVQMNGTRGCGRQACGFAHPSDPDWKTSAPSAAHPAARRESDLTSKDRTVAREHERPVRRPPSPPPSSASSVATKLPERLSGSPVMRKDSFDSMRSSRRDLGERLTSPPRERRREPERTGSTSTLVESSRDKRSEDKVEKGNGNDRKRYEGLKERAGSTSSVTSKPGPSSEMMPPPPVKQPPPLPRADAKDSEQRTPRQEKLDAWVGRVRDMSNAVIARSEYVKLERDMAGLRQLIASRRGAEFSKETQSRLQTQLEAAELRFQNKKEELNTIVYRLIDSDLWPVPPQLPLDMSDREEKFREVRITVMELKDKIQDLSTIVHGSLRDTSKQTSAQIPPPTPQTQHRADAMVADESRPAKRRRLSSAEEPAPVDSPHSAQVDPAIEKALDSHSERLYNVESKLSDIENDMVQYDNDLHADLESRIDEKMSHWNWPSTGGENSLPDMVQGIQGEVKTMQEAYDVADRDIKELATEVGNVIRQSTAVDENVARIRAENEMLQQRITFLEEQRKASEDTMQTFRAELKAINAAMTAYISRPPDPVPPPILPDVDTLVEILRPSLIGAMREVLGPILQNQRTEVEGLLESQTRQISTSLLSKLTRVLKTERYIQEWLEQECKVDIQADGKAVTINAVNGVSPTSSQGLPPLVALPLNGTMDAANHVESVAGASV